MEELCALLKFPKRSLQQSIKNITDGLIEAQLYGYSEHLVEWDDALKEVKISKVNTVKMNE